MMSKEETNCCGTCACYDEWKNGYCARKCVSVDDTDDACDCYKKEENA